MPAPMTEDRQDAAVERYGQHFNAFPPLRYMLDLSDDAFVARVDRAITEGKPITAEEFEDHYPPDVAL